MIHTEVLSGCRPALRHTMLARRSQVTCWLCVDAGTVHQAPLNFKANVQSAPHIGRLSANLDADDYKITE